MVVVAQCVVMLSFYTVMLGPRLTVPRHELSQTLAHEYQFDRGPNVERIPLPKRT
jgi:hypothetical protein